MNIAPTTSLATTSRTESVEPKGRRHPNLHYNVSGAHFATRALADAYAKYLIDEGTNAVVKLR